MEEVEAADNVKRNPCSHVYGALRPCFWCMHYATKNNPCRGALMAAGRAQICHTCCCPPIPNQAEPDPLQPPEQPLFPLRPPTFALAIPPQLAGRVVREPLPQVAGLQRAEHAGRGGDIRALTAGWDAWGCSADLQAREGGAEKVMQKSSRSIWQEMQAGWVGGWGLSLPP